MRYLKSFFVGAVGAMIASVLWVLALAIIPLLLPSLIRRFYEFGSGGIVLVSVSRASMLPVALVGFLLGFFWMFRKAATVRRSR